MGVGELILDSHYSLHYIHSMPNTLKEQLAAKTLKENLAVEIAKVIKGQLRNPMTNLSGQLVGTLFNADCDALGSALAEAVLVTFAPYAPTTLKGF